MADVEKRPVQVYIAHGNILHDGQLIEDGAEVRGSRFSAEQEAELRSAGALKLPVELAASPEDVQDVLNVKDQQIAELQAHLAELQATSGVIAANAATDGDSDAQAPTKKSGK